jgi:hypothetical protein
VPYDLHREFPAVSLHQLNDLVSEVSDELLQVARFEDFVPLLTHRHARERLRAEWHVLAAAAGLGRRGESDRFAECVPQVATD